MRSDARVDLIAKTSETPDRVCPCAESAGAIRHRPPAETEGEQVRYILKLLELDPRIQDALVTFHLDSGVVVIQFLRLDEFAVHVGRQFVGPIEIPENVHAGLVLEDDAVDQIGRSDAVLQKQRVQSLADPDVHSRECKGIRQGPGVGTVGFRVDRNC